MTTTPITPEMPPPEFNNWTEVWDEHQLRGAQLRAAATTIASLRAENERLTTLLAAAQAECERVRREFGEYRLSRLTSITMKSERSRRAAVDTKGLSDPDALEGIR
jgi:hypothetical protein